MTTPAPRNRFHVSVSVSDLARSVTFYTELFGEPPTVEQHDYARWLLDDPRVNFALTTHGARAGVDHVGIQAPDEEQLVRVRERLSRAEAPTYDQPDVTCCYARSTKTWTRDPDGLAWETFVTHGASVDYGDGSRRSAMDDQGLASGSTACCGADR